MDGRTFFWVLIGLAIAVLLTIETIRLIRGWQQCECRIDRWEFDSQKNMYKVAVSWPHVPGKKDMFELDAKDGNAFEEILFNDEAVTTPLGYVFHYATFPFAYILWRISLEVKY